MCLFLCVCACLCKGMVLLYISQVSGLWKCSCAHLKMLLQIKVMEVLLYLSQNGNVPLGRILQPKNLQSDLICRNNDQALKTTFPHVITICTIHSSKGHKPSKLACVLLLGPRLHCHFSSVSHCSVKLSTSIIQSVYREVFRP